MTAQLENLPDDTIVFAEWGMDGDASERLLVVRGGKLYGPTGGVGNEPLSWGNLHSPYHEITSVLVRVPDGMTVGEATERLARPADVEWVPWPVEDWGQEPEGARCRDEWTEPGGKVQRYIHPDDVPTDPDADLVEAMASSLAERSKYKAASWEAEAESLREFYRSVARDAIAVVREHEAQR